MRELIERYQPLLSLHGHIHESRAIAKIGKTTCVNPGSAYSEGVIDGAVVELRKGKVKACQLVPDRGGIRWPLNRRRSAVAAPGASPATPRASGARPRARDVFIYNTNNQNVGIGVTFMVLLIPALYAGGSMLVATFLAGLLALPMACVYAYFAAAMPRSGGDYVYIGRTLHPFLALPGVLELDDLADHLHRHPGCVPGAVRPVGPVPRAGLRVRQPDAGRLRRRLHPQVVDLRRRQLLLIFFAIVFSIGTRLYFRIQNVTFAIAMLGVVVGLAVLAVKGHADTRTSFNAYISGIGGSDDAVKAMNKSSGNLQQAAFDLKQTLYAMVWPLFITLYAITSSFLGGEVRNARRSQFLAMPGSIVYVTILMLLLIMGLDHAAGTEFLGRLGRRSPADLGISGTPTYNELTAAMVHNQGWLMIILGVSFVFWTYVWLPINFLAATRAFLAWAFDGLFPPKLAEVNERYHTPVVAIAVPGCCRRSACTCTWTGSSTP